MKITEATKCQCTKCGTPTPVFELYPFTGRIVCIKCCGPGIFAHYGPRNIEAIKYHILSGELKICFEEQKKAEI